jgi:hypothetical protein
MGGRERSESVDRDGSRWCKLMIAAHMVYDSSHDCQFVVPPYRVILAQIDLHVLATSADMVCWSRLSQPIFPHLSGRSNSKLDDRVQMAMQVSVVCWPREMPDGCDSGSEKAACRCESPIDFAGVVRRACMRVQELAWAIDGGSARPPCRASGVGCTFYHYNVRWVSMSRG